MDSPRPGDEADPMQTDRLARHLEEQLPRHLALLEDWVGVNTHSQNAEGVNELGRRTAAAFARLGFEARAHPSAVPDAGAHVLLTRGPAKRVPPGSGRTVAM